MTGETLFLFGLLSATVMGNPRAILEIVVHKTTEDGDYKTETEHLNGHFTHAGSIVGAEGRIIQVRFFSLYFFLVIHSFFQTVLFARNDASPLCSASKRVPLSVVRILW